MRKIYSGLLLSSLLGSHTLTAQHTDSVTLDEVVVTGQYTPQSMKNSVYKITVINQEKIQAKSATNVQQILNTELGIRYSNDMALGVSDVGMMGMSGRNLKILIDGVPVLDRGDIRESLNQIDISQIEKIEMVEGPMSIVYGSDALAGVINIITKKPEEESWQINARIQEETVGKEYKPFGTRGLHAQYVSAQWDLGHWNAMISLNHNDFRGFGADTFGRNHAWKPKEQWLPSMKIGYRSDRFNIYYRPDYLYETILTKGAINMDTYKGSNKEFVTNKTAHQLQAGYVINDRWSANAISNYSHYTRNTSTIIKNFATQEETLSTAQGDQDVANFDNFTFRTTAQYIYSGKWSFQPGFEINYEQATGDRIEGNPSYTDFSAFLSAEYKPTNSLNLRPGLRVTKNSLYEAPPLIPSINALYRFNDHYNLRASYARGYRAPALRELYFDFVDANHNLKGNPDLEAENSNSVNASLTYINNYEGNKVISSELGGFFNTFDNLISLAANPEDPNEYINVNIDEYRTAGVSWKNRFRTDDVEIALSGLMLGQYNRLKENEDLFPGERIPYFSWSPEVSLELNYFIQKTRTRLSLFYKYTGVRQVFNYTVDSQDNYQLYMAKISAYHYADFTVNQYVNQYLNVSAGIRNLFDLVNIQNTGVSGGVHSSGGPVPFGYGRSYFISLNLNLSNNNKSE